ncbi:MAG: glycosyltransferase [Candidatus Omnitrophica bacterium]|nr:glycosyltransferase [Candidatus Omnitrophota bacterium]
MKKILFLEQYTKISGGQKVLLSILDGLKSDYRFCVTVPERGELTEELDKRNIAHQQLAVGYYSLGKKTLLDVLLYLIRLPYLVLRLSRIIKQEKPDLVYANAARTFVCAAIACSLAKVPLVWHVHSIFDKGISRKLCNYFGKNKIVKKIIVVSQAAKAPLADLADKIEVIYNAIDEKIYYPGEKQGPIRQSLNLGNNLVAAMVSLLVEWKCIDDFIRAAGIISADYPQVKFLIVGDVLYDQAGKKYKQDLLDLVKQLKLENKVIFTGFRNDVAAIMRELDIFVLASKQPDPCPTSLLQAMGSGMAVIATDFGGPAEIIQDQQDGLLYPAQDYKILAAKIKSLITDEKKRKQLSKNAADKINQDFNYKNYMLKIKQIIENQIKITDKHIYGSGKYLENNPTWHQEDADWKSREIIKVIPKSLKEKFKKTKQPIRIVDIGCGTGQILKNLAVYWQSQNIPADCKGYDLSEQIIEQAKKNFPQAEFSARDFASKEYKIQDKRIDFTLLIDILEHIESPQMLLADVAQVSDYIICHLPLEDNLMVNSRKLKDKFKKTVGHINYYNKKSALAMFAQAGLSVGNVIYTCSDCSADYKLESLPRRLILQPLRKLFFKISPDWTAHVLGNCSLMLLLKKQKL